MAHGAEQALRRLRVLGRMFGPSAAGRNVDLPIGSLSAHHHSRRRMEAFRDFVFQRHHDRLCGLARMLLKVSSVVVPMKAGAAANLSRHELGKWIVLAANG